MPLFKLPFEENFPINTPFEGHPQPVGAGPAGGNGAGAGLAADAGLAVPAGLVIMVVLLEDDGEDPVFVTTVVGVEPVRPSKRIV
ncbi:hypothetical protein AO284_03965 [Pseudomonas sp. NZIPFR-PS2]|nr:hypothetical protein AO284_03965 [Pseudomonas sp. NZIPFR-PS2]